jgi:hypothetical protein
VQTPSKPSENSVTKWIIKPAAITAQVGNRAQPFTATELDAVQ